MEWLMYGVLNTNIEYNINGFTYFIKTKTHLTSKIECLKQLLINEHNVDLIEEDFFKKK